MEPKMEQPKTVEMMIREMRNAVEFAESRLSFIGERYPHADGKEVAAALEEVKSFINSKESKAFFDQWYDNAVIFNMQLSALRSVAESAEKEYQRGNMNENEDLKKTREILEDLKDRVQAAVNLTMAA